MTNRQEILQEIRSIDKTLRALTQQILQLSQKKNKLLRELGK
jgi:hypothetical protein